MKLLVYKGFQEDFLKNLANEPLLVNSIEAKTNVFAFDKKYKRQLEKSLLTLDDEDTVWLTYEEYSIIKNLVDDEIEDEESGLELTIYRNNKYPDYYPVPFVIDSELANEIVSTIDGYNDKEKSEECTRFINVYNSLLDIDGRYYASFYNHEYDTGEDVKIVDFYPMNLEVKDSTAKGEINVFINDDVETYLKDLQNIIDQHPKIVGVKSTSGDVSKRMQKSLQAYCLANNILLINYNEKLEVELQLEKELISIAKEDLNIAGFDNFRTIKFYKNPDIDKEVADISQGQIIQDIIKQCELAYNEDSKSRYRDIFITASTGAGKSVMFQIPAVYLAKKYNKLTIIIEPVKALMQDQKEKLNKSGYLRVEAFNSDLITQVQKEAVLNKIKAGEVDLLYLSPETLLSYSIETIIGDREIGLLIVDEAHIVTTWGVGFRPDYWYLGGYINQLRNRIQTQQGMKRKIYKFPICSFTATAINGGVDDSVSDTIISLYMENPIKYIGYVRRDDIKFDIAVHDVEKLPKAKYDAVKTRALNTRLKQWLANGEKTIVYFPYAKLAGEARSASQGFGGLTVDRRIGTYTGRNINDLSTEAFNEEKRITFEKFRNGKTVVMYATKAFGMGVDVDDVKNVYHYAASGNLCDYVQEIGRAARKSSMVGTAITDYYYNDSNFINVLFGMSQIRQYQIREVLEGIYTVYKSKHNSRNFLISPEAFTYIFRGNEEDQCINKLKTCLLMLEKDFYDKYNFKVLISRPQSIFTKAFVCIKRDEQSKVLASKYGEFMNFMEKGRFKEQQCDGSFISDEGDIYTVDLKGVWEKYYPNISFPQFKYWYFNSKSTAKDKVNIMSEIADYIYPRQKIIVEARGELLLSDIKTKILDDFTYIADVLHDKFSKQFFTIEDFTNAISERYGKTKARIIANSIFDLVDPDGFCIKRRVNDGTGKTNYTVARGNFKEYLRRAIVKSNIVNNISMPGNTDTYSSYINMLSDNIVNNTALKLLSIFDYISYEVAGGEEPEIFIRLNDPSKIRSIILGETFYSNGYVTKAKQKHDRDVQILLKFFKNLQTDEERWNFIEDYFLGYDVLVGVEPVKAKTVKLSKAVDKEHSYPTNEFRIWDELLPFFDDMDHTVIKRLMTAQVPIPEYLQTEIKKSREGDDILMCWASKDVLICKQETSDKTLEYFENKGWHAYRMHNIDYEKIKKETK